MCVCALWYSVFISHPPPHPLAYLSPVDLECVRIISVPSLQCEADTPLDASTFLHPGINVLQVININTLHNYFYILCYMY